MAELIMEKSVLITGASSGIGKETAELLSSKGYMVFACIRKKTDKFELEKISPNICGVYMDISNPSGIDKAFWFVLKKAQNLTAIINCAGIAVGGPLETMPVKRIKQQFEINTFGTFSVIQRFLPLIKEGRIIYISSMASSGIFPFLAPYCASKRATDILLNSLSNEFKNENIKIISVKPGVIRTPLWDKAARENLSYFQTLSETCRKKYEAEMNYLVENSRQNNHRGAFPADVAQVVLKALESKNPKSSYTVGKDAFWVMLLSKICPQGFINSLTKLKLSDICKKYQSK